MSVISGIQMIGTQRSGSNLLRVIIDQSPEIASPHPPHILVTFMPLIHLYGSLEDDLNYKQLISDIVDYVNANPVPWEGIILDKEEIYKRSARKTLFEVNKLIYEQAAISKHASMWCCKSMNNVYFAEQLEAQHNINKYIYLYRDGRDVAASFKKAIVGEKHIYFIAKQWKEDQEACLKLKEQISPERIFSLNYEDLTGNPENTVKALCGFLTIPYAENMLSYYTSSTSKLTAASGEMWSNLEKPIIKDNTGKFLREFKDNDLEIFELVAGDVLQKLGYPLYTDRSNKDLISADAIDFYKEENTRLKKESTLGARPSDLEKRGPQELILNAIKARFANSEIK